MIYLLSPQFQGTPNAMVLARAEMAPFELQVYW